MKIRKEEEYTEGRGGLRIPNLYYDGVWNNSSVLSYLRSVQTVNGLDVSIFRGDGERRQPRSFHNVLMIGKTGIKPLVVIEGSYEARARSDVEYELRRNRARQEWGTWSPATTGFAKHAIHISPVELKESTALLEIQATSKEGGYGNGLRGGPSLYISGERKEVSDFFPEPNDYTLGNQQLGRVAYSDFLKQTLTDVVDLLK